MLKYTNSLAVSVLLSAAVFSATIFAQEQNVSARQKATQPPQVTAIPGGYYVEFPQLTNIDGFQIKGNLTGRFEVVFDIAKDAVGQKPKPPESPEILRVLANYWIVRGKPENAISIYERGLKTSPDNFLFQNNLAMLLSEVRNDHDKALELIDKAMEKFHDDVIMLDTKGLVLINANRPEEAIPVLERAVTLSCQGPIYMLHLAQAMDLNGRETSAKNWFDKAKNQLEAQSTRLSKDNQEMFDNLNRKYFSVGE